uniref:RED-like N-terminal domain-containing protein n=1 Tax=Pseudo-nitzschia australis TaxID=44445 RepID=A0A7S4AVL0_9STRA|mmetsp:Transcript_22048/g.47949  ORF Transcript_22048/g.47949 Transcript_22048/m.47949 type:complete len:419 (-) Transcript_22048:94-1350(-)
MDNNAFKNLVRTHNTATSSSSSSKAIARKAVEEEFQKKKKRKRGGYASSSDDDDDDRTSRSSKSKRKQQGDNNDQQADGKDDDAKAIQKDLSARYRDRAKERREGKPAATNGDNDSGIGAGLGADDGVGIGSSSNDNNNNNNNNNNGLLIIPHNIKGLDLALARKERRELLQKKQTTLATKENSTDNADTKNETTASTTVRTELPSMDQAHHILEEFLSSSSSSSSTAGKKDNNKNDYRRDRSRPYPIRDYLSKNMVEYLEEILRWKKFDITSWDCGDETKTTNTTTGTTRAAGRSVQQTKYALAIDGNPLDATRAWEIPREYTLSGFGGRGSANTPSLTIVEMNRIDAVFCHRNSMREKQKLLLQLKDNQKSFARSKQGGRRRRHSEKKNSVEKFNTTKSAVDDDEDNDDMFGGLDD